MNTLFTHSKKLAMLCLSAGLLFPITTQAESELTLGNGRNSITQLQQISKIRIRQVRLCIIRPTS